MQLNDILNKYEKLKKELLFKEAQEVLMLISDEELYDIYQKHSDLFMKLSETDMPDMESIKMALNIFIKYLKSRKISEDEFNEMTLDDIMDYIKKLSKGQRSKQLLEAIRLLEK